MSKIQSFEQISDKLSPVISQLEELRSGLLKDAWRKSLIWSTGLTGTGIVVSLIAVSDATFGLVGGVILSIIACLAIFSIRAGSLSPRYKKELIGGMVGELVENGSYQPESGIAEAVFNQTDLFNRPDRYHSEDLISGKIDKTTFCFAEVHAEEKHTTTNSKGQTRTTWTTLFQGFMFIADFHKDFAGQTVIRRNSFLNFIRGNRVKLEDTVFEKRFDVFSTDQVEARYILTPSMMERIVALDKQFGNDLLISFRHSKVIVMVKDSQNHFECSLTRKISKPDKLREEYLRIASLISIVDALDLNTRIWTKE